MRDATVSDFFFTETPNLKRLKSFLFCFCFFLCWGGGGGGGG